MLFIAAAFKVDAQSLHPLVPDHYVFATDSISGFDENTAKQAAFGANAYGDEYKVFMYMAKREYIKNKYNLQTAAPKSLPGSSVLKTSALTVANCVNEDFEEGSLTNPVPSTITIGSITGVNGWTVTSGTNSGSTGSCLLSGSYVGVPNACQVISTSSTTGATDPIIGAGYPLYSVFGNNPNNGSSVVGNPAGMKGDWFIKINNQSGGAGIHKLVKTINVTPANALFQFAFIAVIQGAHCCCDNAGFALKVKIGATCGAGTYTSCPTFTASPPAGAGCSPTGTCGAGQSTTYLNAATSGWYYNKWRLNTMDLSGLIGSCVTIEVYAIDCPWSGHAGYVYFDAQCNPMAIIGNGTSFPAGTPQITLPTCGTGNTATITAPPGMAPYLWAGPDPLVNGSTAQTVTTSVTGNYTITMNPPGSCGPTVKQVSVVISPAPNLAIASNTQVSCTSTVNGVSLVMGSGTAGTTTPQYTVTFAPTAPTNIVGVSANTATYTGMATGVNTITITDAAGCIATQTINMLSAPPIPSFSISAPGGTMVGCAPPSLTLIAVNTSTLANMTYTWSSITTGTATGATWIGGAPTGTNVLTVTGMDATVGSCPVTQTFAITQNTAVPSVTVTPVTRTITCNGAPATFTAITTTTTNITGVWLDPGATIVSGPSATPLLLSAGAPGTYTVVFTNVANGCSSSQTVAVIANTTVPTMSVNSPNGFTITCSQPTLGMNIQASPGPAPKTYTWINVSSSASVTPVTGGYTVTTPGQYIAFYRDGNNCTVSNTITVMIDTLRPSPMSITNMPSNGYTLTCTNPVLTATAITNPMLPITNYSWTTPPNLTVSQNTVTLGLSNFAGTQTLTTYTVMATAANGCVGKAKVNFIKDTYVPPYTAVFTPSAITCANSCVALSPGASTSTIPVTYTFTSPAPTMTANSAGALFCNPGTYTMTYQSTLNGCTATTTTLVTTNLAPPSTVAIAPIQMLCGQTTATLTAGTTTTSTSYSYTWDGPVTAGMSCPGGVGCYSTTTNQSGVYNVSILNIVNGCISTNTMEVLPPSLVSSIEANPSSGFAPLNVNFSNGTSASSTTGTVTTFWSYGNGITVTTSSAASTYSGSATPYPGGSTIYNAPGTYTVTMIITQNSGTVSCTGTATTVVTVDIPSDLTVPNVFTPNGDGVNDNFTLTTANLTDITFTVFDRWGVKMYDVQTDKGNVSWDGKNFGGKDAPVGTYFYTLKATGKDAKDYEQKGSINLFR